MSLVYDLDESEEIIEPFVIKIDGIEFKIKDFPVREYDRITALPDLADQLSEFSGVPRSEIEDISLRKVAAALKIISQEIKAPLARDYSPKNMLALESTKLN
jgi:2-methylcitrate dehydratase PrpD